jgi:hypothetical protein
LEFYKKYVDDGAKLIHEVGTSPYNLYENSHYWPNATFEKGLYHVRDYEPGVLVNADDWATKGTLLKFN